MWILKCEYLPLLRVSGINWCQASYLYQVNSVALKQEMSQLTADNFLIPYRHKTQPEDPFIEDFIHPPMNIPGRLINAGCLLITLPPVIFVKTFCGFDLFEGPGNYTIGTSSQFPGLWL